MATSVLFKLLFIAMIIVGIPVAIILFPTIKRKNQQVTLEQLKQNYEQGLITEEEYNQKKTEILNKL